MSGVQAIFNRVCVSCLHRSANLTTSHCLFVNKQATLKPRHKLHFFAEKSSYFEDFALFSDKPQNVQTTFADVKPIEGEHFAVNQIASLLSQSNADECSSDVSGNFELKSDTENNVQQYPLMQIAEKTFTSIKNQPFTMTYAGRRYYSTKNSTPESSNIASESDDVRDVAEEDEAPATKAPTKAQQLRRIFAIYGAFGIAFHIVISLTSLGIMYLIVSSGVDVVGLLAKLGIEMSSIAGGASTMVIAYAIHKLILPIRASITIVSVPALVRYLRKAGYLKK